MLKTTFKQMKLYQKWPLSPVMSKIYLWRQTQTISSSLRWLYYSKWGQGHTTLHQTMGTVTNSSIVEAVTPVCMEAVTYCYMNGYIVMWMCIDWCVHHLLLTLVRILAILEEGIFCYPWSLSKKFQYGRENNYLDSIKKIISPSSAMKT